MADLELCAAISDAFGPSGYEKEAVDVIESSLGGLAAHRDSMQNLYVSLPQNVGGRPLVMLDAHTDEVGFMVQSITATGLLRIVPLGGWVEHNIPAHTFLLHNRRGETVRAVSTSKPPHFMTAAARRFRWRASCWTPECAAAKTPQSCLDWNPALLRYPTCSSATTTPPV